MTNEKPIKPLTRAQQKLMDAGAIIAGKDASAEDRAFMARQLVQATLPHTDPGDVPVWVRKNGHVTLVIQPGYDRNTKKPTGYPYGTIPRLLLFWITTEALMRKSKRLELGNSLASFMAELGLNSQGGPRGDITRLKDQMKRLTRARISFEDRLAGGGTAFVDMQVADAGMVWWDTKDDDENADPKHDAVWDSWIELTPRFYEAITANPVPVDMRALRALKKSPLALDLYSWLTYEAFKANRKGKSRFVSWGLLMEQLGANYSDTRDFRRKVKEALGKILEVYPRLKLGDRQGGIEVLASSLASISADETVDI